NPPFFLGLWFWSTITSRTWGGVPFFAVENSVVSRLLNYEIDFMCMFFLGWDQKFQNSCKSAGIFDETGSFL
ncbi:hypothetical protein LBW89_18620, partial [Paenibacillus sp. alder61]|uniref:hypothetical protein n=1 Tax=Paenibacillus sp. alder61 TaxID=2862948 RepID=UPI001CD330E0